MPGPCHPAELVILRTAVFAVRRTCVTGRLLMRCRQIAQVLRFAQDDISFGGWGIMRKGKAAKTVDEYLANTPEPARSSLKHIRAVIQTVVPKETTEVISYGIPMFKYNRMLMGYA